MGQYVRLEKLGGTNVDVFKGRSRITNEIVALKEISIDEDAGLEGQAIREISLLKELRHRNVVQLHDVVSTVSKLVLVFEYFPHDLPGYMRLHSGSHAPSGSTVRSFMHQLLTAVAFCHGNNVLHRDIKPQHIFINAQQQLKLGGFCLARTVDFPVPMANEVTTLWYRAPEILLGSRSYGRSMDVWSCGCVFSEMMTGVPLFRGLNITDQLTAIIKIVGTPSEETLKRMSLASVHLLLSWILAQEVDCWIRLRLKPEIQIPEALLQLQLQKLPFTGLTPQASEDALDLLEHLVAFDPSQRLTAFEALCHPYFTLSTDGTAFPRPIIATPLLRHPTPLGFIASQNELELDRTSSRPSSPSLFRSRSASPASLPPSPSSRPSSPVSRTSSPASDPGDAVPAKDWGEAAELKNAIDESRRAVELMPSDHPDLPRKLSVVGAAFMSRFASQKGAVDLDEAIKINRRAVGIAPIGHVDLPVLLIRLSASLHTRWRKYRRLADLDEAIQAERRAVGYTSAGHIEFPRRTYHLGSLVYTRFLHSGAVGDLDEVIQLTRRAVELCASDHADLPGWFGNLGILLYSRFEYHRHRADLEESIEAMRKAIQQCTPTGREMPGLVGHLSVVLHTRFSLTGSASDLAEAIRNSRQALQLSSNLGYPRRLCGLAALLHTKFSKHEISTDLDQAISLNQQAVDLTPVNNPDRALFLNSLGNALHSRFERYRDLVDLENAIEHKRGAVNLTPPGHAAFPHRLLDLATSFQSRFHHSGSPDDLDEAISIFSRGSRVFVQSTGFLKFQCATKGASLGHSQNRLLPALEAYSIAISLLSQIAWLGQTVESRQAILTAEPASLAGNAAACAIRLGHLERAVELLEQGRSIFWSQITNLHAELTELRLIDMDLAERLERAGQLLVTSTFHDSITRNTASLSPSTTTREAEKHRRLALEWETLVNRVRVLPRFENFLKPLPFAQLQGAASDGPVIIVNTSVYRCDALIVSKDNPTPTLVPLPDLTLGQAKEFADQLRTAQNLEDPSAFVKRYFNPMLQVLWQVLGRPIWDALGYKIPPPDAIPQRRVWWCPTGPLSFLPLHAMGPYARAGGVDLTKRILSSYTSSLSALLRARTKHIAPNDSISITAIGQSATPGQRVLPRVTDEILIIQRKAHATGVPFSSLQDSDATRATVTKALNDISCAHFACHGHQGQNTASLDSALILHDGALELSTIASVRMINADFAFLSACHSANGMATLPDEALHIAAGMQVAGFRSVIATLWAVEDSTGPRVSKLVYEHLLRHAPKKFDSSEAALALNLAVSGLRVGKSKMSTIYWVPFVHIGI